MIARLQQVHLVVDDIKVQAKELAMMDGATLEPFAPHFEKLLSQFPQEFDRYRLDSIVVAAIAPVVSLPFVPSLPLAHRFGSAFTDCGAPLLGLE